MGTRLGEHFWRQFSASYAASSPDTQDVCRQGCTHNAHSVHAAAASPCISMQQHAAALQQHAAACSSMQQLLQRASTRAAALQAYANMSVQEVSTQAAALQAFFCMNVQQVNTRAAVLQAYANTGLQQAAAQCFRKQSDLRDGVLHRLHAVLAQCGSVCRTLQEWYRSCKGGLLAGVHRATELLQKVLQVRWATDSGAGLSHSLFTCTLLHVAKLPVASSSTLPAAETVLQGASSCRAWQCVDGHC